MANKSKRRRSRWPSGWMGFKLKSNSNDHWRKGDVIELLSTDKAKGWDFFIVRHYCGDDGYSHEGWMFDIGCLDPLNADARAMLAIAKAAR